MRPVVCEGYKNSLIVLSAADMSIRYDIKGDSKILICLWEELQEHMDDKFIIKTVKDFRNNNYRVFKEMKNKLRSEGILHR